MLQSLTGLGPYEGKPASLAKHAILEKYLEQLLFKVGHGYGVLNYVDGFAGPWRSGSETFSDTSPYIAINTLRKVRDQLHENRGRHVEVRGAFVERDSSAVGDLRRLLGEYRDVETRVCAGILEDHVPEVLEFVGERPGSFTFTFLDPTGWKDIVPEAIRPLLEIRPGEVLVNLMMSFIHRFVRDPVKQGTIRNLVSPETFRAALEDEENPEVDYRLVQGYCRLVAKIGGYKYVVPAPILDPRSSKILYYLIYASRSHHGLKVFRDVECRAISQQDWAKAVYTEGKRFQRSGQYTLFSMVDSAGEGEAARMQRFFVQECRRHMGDLVIFMGTLTFEELLHEALETPMIRTKALTDALREWRRAGLIEISGLQGRQEVPEYGRGQRITWIKGDLQ